MTTVTLDRVTASYVPGVPVLHDISLSIDSGERFVLLGPSGCGKTSILRVVAGLMTPTSGEIRFDGRSMTDTPPEKRGSAMVFQEPALVPFRSVAENVGFGLKLRKVPRSERDLRVDEALAAVHLEGLADRWPGELSGGQRQRVALARALIVVPDVLLLDEPMAGLDPNLRGEMGAMIADLQRRIGITTIIVTHDHQEAEALADRVGAVVDGHLRQVGPYREVAADLADSVQSGRDVTG